MSRSRPAPEEPPVRFRLPPRSRFQLILTLTFECNLGCDYCYLKLQGGAVMPRETAQQALELAFSCLEPGGLLDLAFFGGEPLARLGEILELTAAARKRGEAEGFEVRPCLTTNGTLLTPEVARRLEAAGVAVTVSLDGVAAAHDRYRRQRSGAGTHALVTANLRGALAAGLAPSVNMVVDPATVEHVAAGVAATLDLGVHQITLSPNYDAHWAPDHLAELERQYQRLGSLYVERVRSGVPVALSFLEEKVRRAIQGTKQDHERCAFGVGELAVDPLGRLFPCERLVRDGGGEQWVVGQLPEGPDPDRLGRLRAGMETPQGAPRLADDCVECGLEPLCSNYCPCVNLSRTGEVGEPDGLVCFVEDLAVRVAEQVLAALHPELAAPPAGGTP